jgi:hypothetical protein
MTPSTDIQLTSLNAWVIAQLEAKSVFNGLTVLADDRGGLLDEMEKALGALGTVAVVGNAEGNNPNKKALSLSSQTRIGVVLGESDIINQSRVTYGSTVATDAARKALTGITPGQLVSQTGASQDFLIDEAWSYWLSGTTASNADHWSPLWSIYELVELVKRVLHGQSPAAGATMVYESHEFGVPFLAKDVKPDKTAVVYFETKIDYPPVVIA